MEAGGRGYVTEIFTSIQGEGIYAGVKQVFLRLGGCSLRCDYCDTGDSRERTRSCIVRGGAVESTDALLANPLEAREAASLTLSMARASEGVHSLSVTGGEPLDQPEFLRDLLQAVRLGEVPVYLETNGSSARAAAMVAPLVDIVAMDFKLPSLCRGTDLFDEYSRTLPAFGGADLFVKVVIGGDVPWDELEQAARLLAGYDRGVPMVIQPVSPGGPCAAPRPEELLAAHSICSRHLSDVRVIPQMHKLLGLR